MKSLKISDLSLRDGFQSLFAARGRTVDMVLIAGMLDKIGYHCIEVWGGASFDVMHRYLNEDPWERIRQLGRYLKNTPMSMILRGKNLVGYHPYPDDVIKAFIERTAANGISVIRVFDPVNDMDNLKIIAENIKDQGLHFQGAICYSLTSKNGLAREPVYTMKYYLEKVKELEGLGADSICLMDIGGLLAPYDGYSLVSMIKETTSLPVNLYTHSTTGMAPMTHLKAAEAGVDIIDTCLAPFAYRNSNPAAEPLVMALGGCGIDTGIDLKNMYEAGKFIEKEIIPKYRVFLNEKRVSIIDTESLFSQVPEGIISNIANQLREHNSDKNLNEALERLPDVRKDLGEIPMVTPTNQIIGVQTVNNLIFDEKEGEYTLITDQVKKLVNGEFGKTPVPVLESIKKRVQDESTDIMAPDTQAGIGLNEAGRNIKGLAADIEDELIYALFPRTGKRFLKWKYGKEEPPEETKPLSLEAAKKWIDEVNLLKGGRSAEEEPEEIPEKGPGTRTFNVFVEDEFFEVSVDPGEVANFNFAASGLNEDRIRDYIDSGSIEVEKKGNIKKRKEPLVELVKEEKKKRTEDKGDFFFLKAPMPGSVVSLRKKKGDHIKKGEVILVLEAMKMENPLGSPVDGIIKEVRCSGGDQVPKDSILCIIDLESK